MLKLTPLNQHCTLAAPNRLEIWKCNTLIIDHGPHLSLIDGNLNEPELDDLTARFGKPVAACYSTHTHVDHVNNLHFLERRGISIFSPASESRYLSDIDLLLQEGGAEEQAARTEMRDFITGELGFRNLHKVSGFAPESVFADGKIRLQAISLPGHSPGHNGYLVSSPDAAEVLFVADIGLDDFGAWYGFNYCSLADYRAAIARLKKMYDPARQILLSSHSHPLFPGEAGDFDRILTGINATETRIVEALTRAGGQSVADLTFTGLFYPMRSLKRMQGSLRKLYYFWEFYCIQNHLEDLRDRGRAERDETGKWFLQG